MRLESQYSFNHYQTVADCRGPTRNALYASAAVSELDSRGPPGAAASSHDAARPGVTCPGQYGHDRSVTSLRVSAGPGPSLGFGSGWPGMTEPEGPAQPGPGASESKPALKRRHARIRSQTASASGPDSLRLEALAATVSIIRDHHELSGIMMIGR